MNFALDEEQEHLRATARAFLAECSASPQVRAAMDSPLGWDPAVWRRIGGQLGWSAVIVPARYGGTGLGHVELAGLMEELGAGLPWAPFFPPAGRAPTRSSSGGARSRSGTRCRASPRARSWPPSPGPSPA